MSRIMNSGELWLALFLSFYCFTGLWRITAQLKVMLRSTEKLENEIEYARLYYPALTCRYAGIFLAILCGLSIIGNISLPRFVLIGVIFLFIVSLSIAGRGRKLLGQIPGWMIKRSGEHYEGYDESFKRLPKSQNMTAQNLFESGQKKELAGDFDGAIRLYDEALNEDSNFANCMISKGILHCAKDQLEQGRQLFKLSTELLPTSAIAFHLLARVERQLGIKDKAIIHEQKAKENLDNERTRDVLRI